VEFAGGKLRWEDLVVLVFVVALSALIIRSAYRAWKGEKR
jgi:hypothetical protein